MCRITAIKGSILSDPRINALVDELQEYGGSVKQEVYAENDFRLFLNRFDVTTSQLKSGEFPLQNKAYVFAYNGEVYSFREAVFNVSEAISDAHFAFDLINEYGHEVFFREADFEGTFMIYEKKKKILFVYVDQLNTKGCFFAMTESNIFITQELAVLHSLLEYSKAKKDASIHALKRGHCLAIAYNNAWSTHEYKPDFKSIWGGEAKEQKTLEERTSTLYQSLSKAVADRIPKEGLFGVLCGGGIDSSLILKITVDILRRKEQLDRLRIFTLGTPNNPLTGEDNDWVNATILVGNLGPDVEQLHIPVFPYEEWDKYLMDQEVLSGRPRLIPPNPVQTQVRHTIIMSAVLAQVAMKFPKINVVLTGDFADEIFGGYHSMHTGCLERLKSNIQEKLDDLHLNDAARVTLASLRGCKYLVKNWLLGHLKSSHYQKFNASQHPVEVRTPFASPLLAQALKPFTGNNLVGRKGNKVHSKYILRLVAEQAGLPAEIAWRKKIPFNEGGTGIRNTEPDLKEEITAKSFINDHKDLVGKTNITFLKRLGISEYAQAGNKLAYGYALYCASMQAGLEQLMKGNTFREVMPDSNYASSGNLETTYLNLPK